MGTFKRGIAISLVSAFLLQQIPFLPSLLPVADAQFAPDATCENVQFAETRGLTYPQVMWKEASTQVFSDHMEITLAPAYLSDPWNGPTHLQAFNFWKDATVRLSLTNSISGSAQSVEYHVMPAGTANRTINYDSVVLNVPLPPKTFTATDGRVRSSLFVKFRLEKVLSGSTCNTTRIPTSPILGETRTVKFRPASYSKELDIAVKGDTTVQILNGFDPNIEMPVVMEFNNGKILSPYEPQVAGVDNTVSSGTPLITSRKGPFEVFRPMFGDIIECNNVKTPTLARRLPDGTVQMTMDQTKPANKPVPARYTQYRLRDANGNVSSIYNLPAPLVFGNTLEYEGIPVPKDWTTIELYSPSYKWNNTEYYTDDYFNHEANGLERKCAKLDSTVRVPVEAPNPSIVSRITQFTNYPFTNIDIGNRIAKTFTKYTAISSGPDSMIYPIMFEWENSTVRTTASNVYLNKQGTGPGYYVNGVENVISMPLNNNQAISELSHFFYENAGKRGRFVVDGIATPYFTLPAIGKPRIVPNLATIHPQDPAPNSFNYGNIDKRLLIQPIATAAITYQPDTTKKYYFGQSVIGQSVKCMLFSQCANTNVQSTTETLVTTYPTFPGDDQVQCGTGTCQQEYNFGTKIVLPANTLYAGASGFVLGIVYSIWSSDLIELGSVAGYPAIPATPIDNNPPIISGESLTPVTPSGVAGFTSNTSALFKVTIQDETPVSCELVQDGITTGLQCAQGYNELPVTLTGADGTKSVLLRVRDSVNKTSETTRSIILDRAAPTIGGATAISNMAWQNTNPTFSITCADTGAGCREIRYEYSDGYRTPIALSPNATTVTGASATITATGARWLFIQAVDNLGTPTPIGVYYTKVDTTIPTITSQVTAAANKTMFYDAARGAYVTNDPRFTIEMQAQDQLSGVKLDTCIIRQGSNVVRTTCTDQTVTASVMPPQGYPQIPVTGLTTSLTYSPASNLTDGEYTYTLNATDNAINPASQGTVRVIVDTSAPIAPLPNTIITVTNSNPGSTGNSVTFALPSLTDGQNGTGIDRIEFSLQQNNLAFPIQQTMLGTNDPRITIQNGMVIIRPDANGNLPTSLTLNNLPGTTSGGVQAMYTPTFVIFDRAGNPSTGVTLPGFGFDSLKPTIETISLNSATIQGNGTNGNPYRVGTGGALPLSFTVRDVNNGVPGNPSLITIETSTPGVTLIGTNTNIGCSIMQPTCTMGIGYTLTPNFTGPITFTARDSAGNVSDTMTLYATQNSNVPTVSGTIDLASPTSPISVIPAPNQIYSNNRYTVTVNNVANTGASTLTGRLTYRTQEGASVTQVPVMLPSGGMQTRMDFTLDNIAVGAQDLSLVLSNEFGNASAPITIPTIRDTAAPVVTGFNYEWNNDRVTLVWTSLTDASGPVQLGYRVALNGTTYANEVLVNASAIAQSNGQYRFEIPVALQNESAIDVVFKDTGVFGRNSEGQLAERPNTTQISVVKQDILLFIQHSLSGFFVTYAPALGTNETNLARLLTQITSPNTAARTVDKTTFGVANRAVFTSEPQQAERAGVHQFASTLTLNNPANTQRQINKSITIADIINPTGNLAFVPKATLTTQGNTTYLRDDASVELDYSINPAREDSFPVMTQMTVTSGNNSSSIDGLEVLNQSTTSRRVTIPTPTDGTYTINATFTDGAGNSSSQSISITKINVQILGVTIVNAANQAITTVDNANNVYTILPTVKAEVITAGTDTNLKFFINDQEITQKEIIQGLPADRVGTRLTLPALTENNLNNLTLKVQNAAGKEVEQSLTIRHDTDGPNITGTVVMPPSSTTSTIILPAVTITDFSPVRYKITYATSPSEPVIGTFTNNIPLREGNNVFALSFLDALNNERLVNNGANFTTYVDGENPIASATISPARTKDRTATVRINNITDISDSLAYEIVTGNTILANGTIARAQYNQNTDVSISLASITNRSSTIAVRLVDQANNPVAIDMTIVQDQQAPTVAFGPIGTINGGAGIGWIVNATDALGTIQSVSGVIHNTTTGETFSIANDDWQRGNDGSYIGGILPPNVRPGNTYVLSVVATDDVGNPSASVSSTAFTMPTTATEEENPLNDGPLLNPDITGTTIDVTVTNGRDINFTVNDIPRGTQIVLDYILDQHNIQDPANPINVLPIGEYTITIVDDLGHTQISTHTITPYYFSATADLNGDGFDGGITDHRLFEIAQAEGRYNMNTPAVSTLVTSIGTIITNRMTNEYSRFLADR